MLKIEKIKPLFNRIVVTATKYEDVKVGNLIDASKSNTIKEYQTVVAVGTTVRDINVGDIVLINPIRYAVRKHQEGSLKDGVISDNATTGYNFKTLEIAGEQCLLLYDTDIDYIVEKYEEIEDTPVKPKTSLIGVDTPKIIV